MKMNRNCSLLAALCLVAGLALPSRAVNQSFSLSDEAYTLPQGKWELDSSVHLEHDAVSDGYSFSHDLFYGLSERAQLRITLSKWSILSVKGADGEAPDAGTTPAAGGGGEGGAETQTTSSWDSIGLGFGYTFSDPRKEAYGVALFAKAQVGDKIVALDANLALQKNFDSVTLLYNCDIEAEWFGDDLGSLNNTAGEITQALGASIALGGGFHAGVESLYEISMTEWSNPEGGLFVGPNISFQNDRFFVTAAPLWQLTNNSEFEDLQVGVRLGLGL